MSFLEKGLRAAGYSTVGVGTGPDAFALARDDSFDLLLLDLGLPGMSGHEVLRSMRGRGESMPVIILTAKDGIDDTLAGLQGGADDYMKKPFRFEELLARIQLRLRHGSTPETTVLLAGAVRLDLRSRRATKVNAAGSEQTIELSAREFALIEVFLRHPGHVLSREQLLSHAWGYSFDPGSNVVDVYVGYLRRKLGENVIETIRGMGYRLAG